ncbi:MAG TPA: hypothetical protein VE869_01265 [Gemmatimonas sp.]|nr:hypothetical protein [Gemmatimonas sp.]
MPTDHAVGHPAPARASAPGAAPGRREHDAVATFLLPLERSRVDAAGEGCYTTLHRESVDEVLVDLRTQRVSAVLVSVARYAAQHAPAMARLVREFPRVPAVALLSANEPRTTQALLSLGQQGVRNLVDVRDPKGWRDLRSIVANERGESIERRAITRLTDDLRDAPPDCRRFFETLFLISPLVCTVRQLARGLGVVPSTFMSRFLRAGLPAPKRYLWAFRMDWAVRTE